MVSLMLRTKASVDEGKAGMTDCNYVYHIIISKYIGLQPRQRKSWQLPESGSRCVEI